MASSSSGVVKRERGDDEVEGTAKQAKCVKEESSMKPMVPKIEGSVAASPSPGVGLLRRLNLAAGRLPGHCADGRVLNWPAWGEGKDEYYISSRGTVELCVKPAQAVKAEPRVTRPSFTPVYTPVGGDGATVEVYDKLRPVLEKMISWPDGRTEGRVNSCPFSLEGIREIEGRMGSELFEPIACQLEWPNHREQGKMKCDNSCPRKEKRGFHGLYTHARVDKFSSPIMKELHHLLYQVMDNERARVKHDRESWQLGRQA